MTEAEIYAKLTGLFREVFDDDAIILTPGTTAEDIAGWDSQAHVGLVVAAEQRFRVRFRTAELDSLHNVGEFAQLIATRLEGR